MAPSSRKQLLPLLLAALAAAHAPLAAAGSARALKLVGGREARSDSRYSYLARIHFELDSSKGLLAGCGGTLISRRVVLTAAHCSTLARKLTDPENVFVRVGAFNPLTDEAMREDDYALRRVARVVEHPGYVQLGEDQPTSPHDLALLLLDEPVPPRFPAVQLAPADLAYPADGTELHALGWGSTDSENSQPAYTLQDLELPAVSRQLCAQQWGYAGAPASLVGRGHVCAGLRAQANICFGDSGGPLLLRGADAREDVQLGVISFSFPTCALPGMPGVFTWVPQYRDWIDTQLRRLDPEGMPQPPPSPAPAPRRPASPPSKPLASPPPAQPLSPPVVAAAPAPAPAAQPPVQPAAEIAAAPALAPAPEQAVQPVPAVPAQPVPTVPALAVQPLPAVAEQQPAPVQPLPAVAEQQPAPVQPVPAVAEQQTVLAQPQDVGMASLLPDAAAEQAAAPGPAA